MKHAYKIYEGVKEVEYQIAVDVINKKKGEQDIKLMNLGFELSDKRILLPNQEFLGLPRRVGKGDGITFLLESEHIKNIKEKEQECGANIKFVYVTDSIDNRFRAKVPILLRFLLSLAPCGLPSVLPFQFCYVAGEWWQNQV